MPVFCIILLLLNLIRYGASGGITGGGGNLMPATLCLLHKAMAAGDIAKAMEYQKAFNRVQETLCEPSTCTAVPCVCVCVAVWLCVCIFREPF